jgi:Zn-dependent protease with chaperone function
MPCHWAAVPGRFHDCQWRCGRIVLSDAPLQTMNARQMRGILVHEIIHLGNGDLTLMQLAVVVGRLTRVLSQIAFLLVFLGLALRAVSAGAFPLLPLMVLALAPLGINLLQLALARTREAEADFEAAELTGNPLGLASASIKMRDEERALLRNRYPGSALLRAPSLFRDHPATEEASSAYWQWRLATDQGRGTNRSRNLRGAAASVPAIHYRTTGANGMRRDLRWIKAAAWIPAECLVES